MPGQPEAHRDLGPGNALVLLLETKTRSVASNRLLPLRVRDLEPLLHGQLDAEPSELLVAADGDVRVIAVFVEIVG